MKRYRVVFEMATTVEEENDVLAREHAELVGKLLAEMGRTVPGLAMKLRLEPVDG